LRPPRRLRIAPAEARRPVRQGRAPLRRRPQRRRGQGRSGRPVRQGRAPLRPYRPGNGRHRADPVVPSAKDGLHCGDVLSSASSHVPQSSRPPRTGSIAAAGGRFRCREFGGSSRPPRTGSIAASTTTSSVGSTLSGRPVRQGRAPLRPDTARAVRRHLGSRRPVRQGRAPLRHGRAFPGSRPVPRRPVRQGRAPLRPATRTTPAGRIPRRPVRQGRAPLRLRRPGSPLRGLRGASSRPPRTGSIAA